MARFGPVNPSRDIGLAESLNEAVLLALADLDRSQREIAIEQAAEAADPEHLVGMISADDAVRRNAALEALTKGGRRSVPALIRALSDPDPEVVMFAASTLGKTRDTSAIPHLAAVLKHGDVNVCHAAIESLGELRAVSMLDTLGEMLKGDSWLRFAVVHTLGEIGDPSSVRTLLGLLNDENLREGAISALGKIGGVEVLAELAGRMAAADSPAMFKLYLQAIGDALVQLPDPAVLQKLPTWTWFASRANAMVVPRLKQLLQSRTDETDSAVDLSLKEAAIDLVRCLRLEACYPDIVAAATEERLGEALLFAAADIGAKLEPYLTGAVSDPSANVREFVCRAMGAVSLESGAEAVTALLSDPHDNIRTAAIRVVARLHQTAGLPRIVASLLDHATNVRMAALQALCRMDARQVTAALLRDPRVLADDQLTVLTIMRANPHPLQRGYVESGLANPNDRIRQAAVAAFAAQRGADVVESLAPLLEDRSVDVRRGVIAALVEQPGERSRQLLVSLLERDAETRGDVLQALGQIGDGRVVPKIIAIFPTCSLEEQGYAIEVLAAMESPAVEPFLSRQLGHQDPGLRRHVVRAMVRIGTASALRRLGIALRDKNPKVRMAVSKALASCPHPIARSALERLSLDPVESVAAFAREQLGG
jgi:HEAT repeat protein